MAKVRRHEVISAALELLNEAGLEAVTTRRLAQKLGVESASLYWHFRDKATLLSEMAASVLARHHTIEAPMDAGDWLDWIAENARSFRRALLAYRDGARLHAGTKPGPDDLVRLEPKVAYLLQAGFARSEALMVLLAVSQFTIGCVMEEQSREGNATTPLRAPHVLEHVKGTEAFTINVEQILTASAEETFEFGLSLILTGLRSRREVDIDELASKLLHTHSPKRRR